MGLCPYMSTPYIEKSTLQGFTATGVGVPPDFVEPDRDITPTYGTVDIVATGIMTVACRTTACQLWNAIANQCGTNTLTTGGLTLSPATKAAIQNKLNSIK